MRQPSCLENNGNGKQKNKDENNKKESNTELVTDIKGTFLLDQI